VAPSSLDLPLNASKELLGASVPSMIDGLILVNKSYEHQFAKSNSRIPLLQLKNAFVKIKAAILWLYKQRKDTDSRAFELWNSDINVGSKTIGLGT